MTAPKKKAPATRGAAQKPPAPLLAVKSEAEDAQTYAVLARIVRNGETLRPANPATGREADTVQLTDREAYGLGGFVRLLPDTADTTETTTQD